jgi:hypothetical protein
MASGLAKPVTAKEALRRVLEKAGEPMKTRDLCAKALKVKGVKLGGATPDATMAAILATENKKANGLFVRTAPGTYALREEG